MPVLGVIEPGAEAARAASRTGDVLVIATDATVQSHAYAAACRLGDCARLKRPARCWCRWSRKAGRIPRCHWCLCGASRICPTAGCGAPQVAVTAEVIRIYLNELIAEAAALGMNPDTLVLGCTHYPLLRSLIERAVPRGMRVIDSAESAAETAVRLFVPQDSKASPHRAQSLRCFATDSVEKFERLGSRFLGAPRRQS